MSLKEFTDVVISTSILKYENKIDSATFLCANDVMATDFIQKHYDIGSLIKIYSRVDNSLVYQGVVVEVAPEITENGSFLKVETYAYPAIGLNRMRGMEKYRKKTLRQVLVNIQSDLTVFPYTEFYTEQSSATDYWGIDSGEGTISNTLTGLTPKTGTYMVVANIDNEVEGDDTNIWFPKTGSSPMHFPLYIETNSSPVYDPIAETWRNVPYIDFYMYRDKPDVATVANIEMQFFIDTQHYVRFQLTDQDHHGTISGFPSTQDENLHLIPFSNTTDKAWVHLRIPVGSKWGTMPIYVWRVGDSDSDWNSTDDSSLINVNHTKVKSWMCSSGVTDIIGRNLTDFCGWDSRHDPATSDSQNTLSAGWDNIKAIKFLITPTIATTITTNHVVIDGLIFGNMSNPYSIITDDVLKFLHQTPSAYASLNTDFIVYDTQEFEYLEFLYEQGTKMLKDILDLDSAYQYPDAGKHWIVTPDGKLCVAPIGNHHLTGSGDANIDTVWDTNTRYTATSPLTLGQDIIATSFSRKEVDANVVIMNGIFQFPPNNELCGDETQFAGWQFYNSYAPETSPFYNSGDCIIGPNSLAVNPISGHVYPINVDAVAICWDFAEPIDLNLIQSPVLEFWIKTANLQTVEVRVYTDLYDVPNLDAHTSGTLDSLGNYFWHDDLTPQLQSAGGGLLASQNSVGWVKINLPLKGSNWNITNKATWSKPVKRILFRLIGGTYDGWCYLDGLNIYGQTVRAAYSFNKINNLAGNKGSTGVKTKFINESLMAGWSLNPQVLDPLDRLCIAECLRSQTMPTTGSVKLLLDYTIMAGQMLWILSPAFDNTPKQFRVLWVRHDINETGAFSTVYLTDDLLNSYARDPSDAANLAIKVISPDHQNRTFVRLTTENMKYGTPMAKLINLDDIV